MTERFIGRSTHKVDAKGRVSIPAAFRRVLEAEDPGWKDGLPTNLLIFYGDTSRDCLEIYTQAGVNRMHDIIEAFPKGSEKRRALEKRFYGKSVPTTIDDTGRLVLNAKLRGIADVTSEALFLGAGETFEIWNPAAIEGSEAEEEDDVAFYDLLAEADQAARAARAARAE